MQTYLGLLNSLSFASECWNFDGETLHKIKGFTSQFSASSTDYLAAPSQQWTWVSNSSSCLGTLKDKFQANSRRQISSKFHQQSPIDDKWLLSHPVNQSYPLQTGSVSLGWVDGRSSSPPISPVTASSSAAAKSLQSCPTLCDPIDGSPPGFPVPGILQARTLEWVAISFSNAWKWKVKGKSLSRVRLEWPHGLQPTRLLCPWDFLGKSTGVGCHCLLQPVLLLLLYSLKLWLLPTIQSPAVVNDSSH